MKLIAFENAEVESVLFAVEEALKGLDPCAETHKLLTRAKAKLVTAEPPAQPQQLKSEMTESLLRGTFMVLKERGFLVDTIVIPDPLRATLKEKGPQLAILADDVGRLMQERANNLATCYMDRVLP